uniref:Tetratricopeptide repeat (TPR)-like superfamily protein n=1 Tax=Mesocestoides corti TaxID=53468 RepID=A0A5K3EJ90_MESCO
MSREVTFFKGKTMFLCWRAYGRQNSCLLCFSTTSLTTPKPQPNLCWFKLGRSHPYTSRADRSMYHAVSYGTMLHLQATATLEPSDLEAATRQIKHAVKVCLTKRRKGKFTDNFSKSTAKAKTAFYASYTEDEAHAELCYAESLLQWVFLAVLQDEKLVTLIKSSLKLRECYKCYRTCWKIYKNKKWADGPSRAAFECGVFMGVGAFNLLLSLLPSKVLSLLEIVGFSGKKDLGLQLLHEGRKIEHGVRDPLCALIILVYDLYATQMTDGDEISALEEARRILPSCMKKAPDSAFFLFLNGRLETLCGNFKLAREYFFKSIESQSDFVNFHHICYWELMWCHCVQAEWMDAMKYAERLTCESKWSHATYRYLMAAFIIQFLEEERRAATEGAGKTPPSSPISTDPREDADGGTLAKHAEDLLRSVPQMIQRIAGKSLPIEKFAMKKATRYFEQGNRLTLPGLELMYLWNGFKLISNKKELISKFLLTIEAKIQNLVTNKNSIVNFTDDFCMATLLKGVCLRCLKKNFQAKMCFTEVLMNEKAIRQDKYVLPFSEVELCQIAMHEGELDEAKRHLDKAWTYTKYSLEARLHFRLHSLTALLKEKKTSKLVCKSLEASPAGSWHNGLNQSEDGEDNPFNIQFDPKLDNMDDAPITLELDADK